jgi:FkbM family methyltransferase
MVFIRQHIADIVVRSSIPFAFWGNWNKKNIKVSIKDAQFYVRVGTSDKLILWEVWKREEYFDHDLSIKENNSVLDIGAHIGLFTVYAAQKATKGKIYAFEVNPDNFKVLKKNISLNKLKNVAAECIAVTSHNSHANLYFGGRNRGADSLYDGAYRNQSMNVNCTSLDALFRKYHLKHIDLLKIDAEGAEFDIIMNTSSTTLKKIKAITLEYHDSMGLAATSRDLTAFLESHGFSVRNNSPSWLESFLFHTGILIAQKKQK